jgi:hypothetical protein
VKIGCANGRLRSRVCNGCNVTSVTNLPLFTEEI